MKVYPTAADAYHGMIFEIGLALTQWQPLEYRLYQIFVFLCGKSDETALNAIFHQMSLETKMLAITELIRLKNKSRLKDWAEVQKIFFKQKRLRDKLAHWTAMAMPNPKGNGFISFLSPPRSDSNVAHLVSNPYGGAIDADSLRKSSIENFGIVELELQHFMASLKPAS